MSSVVLSCPSQAGHGLRLSALAGRDPATNTTSDIAAKVLIAPLSLSWPHEATIPPRCLACQILRISTTSIASTGPLTTSRRTSRRRCGSRMSPRSACFSPYHFHRIFRALMGETLASFVKRIRLERRCTCCLTGRARASPRSPSPAAFPRARTFPVRFARHYGVAPRRFDVEASAAPAGTRCRAYAPRRRSAPPRPPARGRIPMASPSRCATVRRGAWPTSACIVPTKRDHAAQAVARLLAWAEARGLADGQWLGYQWDDPEIVPLEKCRYDVGLEVPEGTVGDGEVSITDVSALPGSPRSILPARSMSRCGRSNGSTSRGCRPAVTHPPTSRCSRPGTAGPSRTATSTSSSACSSRWSTRPLPPLAVPSSQFPDI